MEVSKFYDEMQMPECAWRDLQEHCEKEMQMLEAATKEAKIKVNVLVRGYMLYYKELGRICALKLAKGERKYRAYGSFLKRITAICEQILEAKNWK